MLNRQNYKVKQYRLACSVIFLVLLPSIPSTMSVYTPFQNGSFQGKFSAKKSKILITWLFNCYPHSPAPPASLTTPSPSLRLPDCFPSSLYLSTLILPSSPFP